MKLNKDKVHVYDRYCLDPYTCYSYNILGSAVITKDMADPISNINTYSKSLIFNTDWWRNKKLENISKLYNDHFFIFSRVNWNMHNTSLYFEDCSNKKYDF